MLSIVPGEPQGFKKPSKSMTFGGRKVIDPEKSLATSSTSVVKTRIKKISTNPEDIERLLENDADALLNMKKDIGVAQNNELEKAKLALASIQKEYDALKIQNDIKERELANISDHRITLRGLEVALDNTRDSYRSKIKLLNDQLADVQENMDAENRTRNEMSYMIHRIEEEINQCKMQAHALNHQLDFVKGEFSNVDSTLRLSRQELIEEELKVQELAKTVQSRSEQRQTKIQELQSVILEGEMSILKVQESMNFTRNNQASHYNTINDAEAPPQATAAGQYQQSVPVPPTQQQLQSTARHDSSKGDQGGDGALSLDSLTSEQVMEIVERYNTRNVRKEKLLQMQKDLKQNIQAQRSKKDTLDKLLEKSHQKLQLLVSNRQMYQEVDMKDAALATARRESEDCVERENRLKNNIDALRRAIPRFLVKVNRSARINIHTIPASIEQLPDVVHKLDDEVARLIKQIGEKMLKDATPEDLAIMSSAQDYSGGGENTSETSRLHKLPGYVRLQKQQFYNLMVAVPDTSDKNVRVQTIANSTLHESPKRGSEVAEANFEELNDRRKKLNAEEFIDSTTIKNISKLIVKKGDGRSQGRGGRGRLNMKKSKRAAEMVEEDDV